MKRQQERQTLKVVQMDCELGNVESNAEVVLEHIQSAPENSLVVFPELTLTGYQVGGNFHEFSLNTDSPLISRLVEACENRSAVIGFIEETDSFSFYNSALVIQNQEIKSIHRKIYLPNYGIFDERKYFSQGSRYETVKLDRFRIAPMICGDAWSPGFVHLAAADLAHVLVFSVCSPVGGMGKVSSQKSWQNLCRMYATLYGCYVVFSNRCGKENDLTYWGGSEVIDPFGETVEALDHDHNGDFTVDLDLGEVRSARTTIHSLRDENFDFLKSRLERVIQLRYD